MPSRPGRAYRLTEPRRQAALANLRKANAVERQRKYRLTERRLAANRANLQKARWTRLGRTPRERRSEAIRRTVIRHGLYCASLVKSLAAAGERRQSFERHLARFRRAFRPCGRTERLLVRRAGEAVWRRLRTFRGLARWQARRLLGVIEQFERALAKGAHEHRDLAALAEGVAVSAVDTSGLASAPSADTTTSLSPEQEARFWQRLGEALDRLFWQSEAGHDARVRRLNARLRRLLARLGRVRRGEAKVAASRFAHEAAANALASSPRPRYYGHGWLWFPQPLVACPATRRQSTQQLVEEALARLERLLAPQTVRERAIAAGIVETLRWRFEALERQAAWEAREVRRLLLEAAAEGGARTGDQTARLAADLREVLEDASGTLAALEADQTRRLGWQMWCGERQPLAAATCLDANEQEAGRALEGLASEPYDEEMAAAEREEARLDEEAWPSPERLGEEPDGGRDEGKGAEVPVPRAKPSNLLCRAEAAKRGEEEKAEGDSEHLRNEQDKEDNE
jgi:hypothetical protein